MAERGNGRVMEIWNCGMDATTSVGVLCKGRVEMLNILLDIGRFLICAGLCKFGRDTAANARVLLRASTGGVWVGGWGTWESLKAL